MAPPAIPETVAAFGEPRPSSLALDARGAPELVAAVRAARTAALEAYGRMLRGRQVEESAAAVGAAFSAASEAVNGLRAIEALVLLRDELSSLVRCDSQ